MSKYTISGLALIALFITIFSIIAYKKNNSLIFTCSADLIIEYPDGNDIYASFSAFIHSDGTGLSTYRGKVINKGKVYILNRDITFDIIGNGSVKTIKYKKSFKKNNDTTPDDIIWSKMYKEGSIYYLSFFKAAPGEFIVQDRGAMTYVCSG